MFTIHEKRLRRAKKALAHKRALKDPNRNIPTFFAPPKPVKSSAPKKSFFQNVASFFRGVFKGGRA